jgi:hypothetical protein
MLKRQHKVERRNEREDMEAGDEELAKWEAEQLRLPEEGDEDEEFGGMAPKEGAPEQA